MDIYCTSCGEPWDMDSLHEEIAARFPDKPWKAVEARLLAEDVSSYQASERSYVGPYFDVMYAEFRRSGCEALKSFHAHCNPATLGSKRASASADLAELLGDDIDALAAFSDDFGLADL